MKNFFRLMLLCIASLFATAVFAQQRVDAVVKSIVSIGVKRRRSTNLLEIGYTVRRVRPSTCLLQCRHQHRRKNRNNGNHNEQFNKGKV